MLKVEDTVLLVIDVQEKLVEVMNDRDVLIKNTTNTIEGIKVFDIPIILTEQVPEKIGVTIPEVAGQLKHLSPIMKKCFNCCESEGFTAMLDDLNRKQILICGIEAHICVYQTAVDLLSQGFEVQIMVDGVSSRTELNKKIGLDRIREAGGKLTTSEMVLFELLRAAEGEKFKKILDIIK